MSKIIFDGHNKKNTITINNTNNQLACITIAPHVVEKFSGTIGDTALNVPGNLNFLARTGSIEVENQHHLKIVDCDIALTEIAATQGTIEFHNSYVFGANEHTNRKVGNNSTINFDGIDSRVGSLTLGFGSTFTFTHNNHSYNIQTPAMADITESGFFAEIENMEKLLSICEFINNKWINGNPVFALEEVGCLRDYQKLDHNFIELFMMQNNMVAANVIDKFIANNFMEFTAVSHDNNLTGSSLQGAGPYNVLGEIGSWLSLNDVNLFGLPIAGTDADFLSSSTDII